jgi:RNA polymerase sigma-54 factor
MKLEMRGQMRLEQRMKLAPHMIQSMEILQLPMLALQERLEYELNSNPVLEMEEQAPSEAAPAMTTTNTDESAVKQPDEVVEDFGRIENLDDGYKDYMDRSEQYRRRSSSNEPDRKLEAMKNTAAAPQSLHDHLTAQWLLVDAAEPVKKAGSMIIDYIDSRGYLSVRLEQLHNKDKNDFNFKHLEAAMKLVQNLEPAGIGARDLKECLLIQISQQSGNMSFEADLISRHMDSLLHNKLPVIAKKMSCSLEKIKSAIEHISKFDTSPGLQIAQERNHAITADVIVEYFKEKDEFIVREADSNLPSLKVSDYYLSMSKDSTANKKTRQFLQDNIRSARWILDAIEQRRNTLLNVTRAVEKGKLHLRPLPMSQVADEVGIHLATVSRAVAGKYVQCNWGILPLRKFFSGGTADAQGKGHSWEAIRAELQRIIDSEDKSNPLNDEQIRQKLADAGIPNLARRTVAKYRKLMNIPVARFRKKY